MISVLCFGLLASAIAAPQFYHHASRYEQRPFFPEHVNMPSQRNFLGENFFDTNRFWNEMSREMREIDEMLADLRRHFPVTPVSQQRIEGNEYKITIPMTGFEEKDIVVKAREGLLMVQARHEYPGGSQKNYLEVRNLPKNLVMNGTWLYDKLILEITFPLKEGVTTVESVTAMATDFTTVRPNFDREEIEEDNDNGVNADVGLGRGDLDKETEILTNYIPKNEPVEATTYAVDLKDEIEFVPVRY